MPIDISEIEPGFVYRTNTDQLRKVERIDEDEKGRNRVCYKAKSARIRGRQFEITHTLSNPPLDTTFARACSHKLTGEEIDQLIIEGVLTREEIQLDDR